MGQIMFRSETMFSELWFVFCLYLSSAVELLKWREEDKIILRDAMDEYNASYILKYPSFLMIVSHTTKKIYINKLFYCLLIWRW